MWPISTRVNKPENDDPSILDRAAESVDWQAPLDGSDHAWKRTQIHERECHPSPKERQERLVRHRDGPRSMPLVAEMPPEARSDSLESLKGLPGVEDSREQKSDLGTSSQGSGASASPL